MSHVTNIILKLPVLEVDKIKDVNKYLEENKKGIFTDRIIGDGHKVCEQPVWVGAFNYLDTQEFIEYIKDISFKYPNEVQIFVCDQHDETFTEKTRGEGCE